MSCIKYTVRVIAQAIFLVGMTSTASAQNDFDRQMVIRDAVNILGGNRNIIVKRNSKVNYRLYSNNPDDQNVVDKVMREISTLTGIDSDPHNRQTIQQSRASGLVRSDLKSGKVNLAIVVSDLKSMQKIAESLSMRKVYHRALDNGTASCFFAPAVSSTAEIVSALIYIHEDLDRSLIDTLSLIHI